MSLSYGARTSTPWFITLPFIGIFILVFYAMTKWTQACIEFWFAYTGHPGVHVPFILAALAGIAGNGVTLMFDVVTTIVRLVM